MPSLEEEDEIFMAGIVVPVMVAPSVTLSLTPSIIVAPSVAPSFTPSNDLCFTTTKIETKFRAKSCSY